MNGPCCYIRAFKSHVNLGFWRGAELDDPEKLIQTGGEKMEHVKIGSPEDVRPAAFKWLVQSAVRLNLAKGNPTKVG